MYEKQIWRRERTCRGLKALFLFWFLLFILFFRLFTHVTRHKNMTGRFHSFVILSTIHSTLQTSSWSHVSKLNYNQFRNFPFVFSTHHPQARIQIPDPQMKEKNKTRNYHPIYIDDRRFPLSSFFKPWVIYLGKLIEGKFCSLSETSCVFFRCYCWFTTMMANWP